MVTRSTARASLLVAALACDAATEAHDAPAAPSPTEEAATPRPVTPSEAPAPEPAPTAEPEATPAPDWPTTELSIALRSTPRGQGLSGCGFELVEHGFPAVSADGSAVAWIRHDTITLSTEYEHELRIDGRAGPLTRISLHTLTDFGGYDDRGSPTAATCKRARTQISAAVATANAELERSRWRALQRLELALVGPDGPSAANRSRAPGERPVELALVHRSLIAKIPQVTVLHREPNFPIPDERVILREAWGDPYSGTAMLLYTWIEDCEPTDTCRCDEWTGAFVTRFDAECPMSERCTTWDQTFY